MERKQFIENVAHQVENNACDIFVGSGISKESGVVSWIDFLRPLAQDIGLHVNETDNLPMIAQYIVNSNSGNRNIIYSEINKVFGKKYSLNPYHNIIYNLNFSTIWTTNYDMLLEEAYKDKNICVICSDKDLGQSTVDKEIKLVKLHGSANGDLIDIVLTQEDYDMFYLKKAALAQKLRDTLLNKSILFIGYSYSDPNIRTVMVEAMKQVKDMTHEHYIIIPNIRREVGESGECFEQKEIRFRLWVSELNRLGIRELIVEKYSDLTEILLRINLASRGRTLFVTGSHQLNNCKYVEEFGEKLTSVQDITLYNGQSIGVASTILNKFVISCIKKGIDLGSCIKMYPNPYATVPACENYATLLPILKKDRINQLRKVKVAIIFGGGLGTKAEFEAALEDQCIIVPGITSVNDYRNDVINEMINNLNIMEYLKNSTYAYYKAIVNKQVPTVSDLIATIEELLRIK